MNKEKAGEVALYEAPQRYLPAEGEIIDQFRILKTLGEGTFGIVYKVEHVQTSSIYALKLLKLWSITWEEERRLLLQRFEMEYHTGLIKSDHLVRSMGFGKAYGNPYILMEFCPDGDLRKRGGPGLSFDLASCFGAGILLGLKDLHANGKIHRDLKPDNVLLAANNHVKLTDFGIAGHKNIRMTKRNLFGQPREIFGTYAYMPPEQLKPRDATKLPATDIFSFGVLMFELLTGQLPFGPLKTESDLAEYVKRVNMAQWDDIHSLRPGIPDHWARIIEKCMIPDYRERYASANEILTELGIVTGGLFKTGEGFPDLSLEIKQGEEFGKIYPLSQIMQEKGSSRLLIGRNDETEGIYNDINIRETPPDGKQFFISRKQATIEKDSSNRWFIRDGQWVKETKTWKNSLNGTYVNSLRETGNGIEITPGEIITVGDTTLKVLAG